MVLTTETNLSADEIATFDIIELLEKAKSGNQNLVNLQKMIADHPGFHTICAGAKHHHYWPGGLETHVIEIIAYMVSVADMYPGSYASVSIEDIILVAALHDFDKIWAYVEIEEQDREKNPAKYHKNQCFTNAKPDHTSKIIDGITRVLRLAARYGIELTEEQVSAIMFAHGGYSDANFRYGGLSAIGSTVMHNNPLAVLLHAADMHSSQVIGGGLE